MHALFNFQNEGVTHASVVKFSENQFWGEISIETSFDNKRAKSSSFKTPTFFILHRLITYSIHARDEGNEKVSSKDLFFLYCLIKGVKVQSAKFFIDHLVHLAKVRSGIICISSYVTSITKYLNVLQPPNKDLLIDFINPTYINIDYLKNSRAFIEKEGRYEYVFGARGIAKQEQEHTRKRARTSLPPSQGEPPQSQAQAPPHPPPQTSKPSKSKIEKLFSKILKKLSTCKNQNDHIHGDLIAIQRKLGMPKCEAHDWYEGEAFSSEDEEAPPSEEDQED